MRPLERVLAQLLRWGTRAASAVVGLGCALALAGASGLGVRLLTAGVALFIALPVVRVAVMLVMLLRARDRRLAAVAALVLGIVGAAYALGAAHG